MCDGPNFLPTTTCGSLTFNQRPSGVPLCTSACQIDVSTCSAGVPGGATGAGGALGAGGYQTGAGGILIGTAGTATGGVGIGGTNVGGNGTGGSVGTGGSNVGGSAGQPMMAPPGEPQIPPAPASCPQLRTGNITVLGQQVQLFVGTKQADKKGAVLFYWHGTGSNSGEASVIMGTQINEITSEGGIVASFTTSTGTGSTTGNLVWYTDDFNMADQILACAIQQLNIDTHRVYTAGCSAGGLQAGAMAVVRSAYIAAAMPNSGGSLLSTWESANTPALITAHGSCSGDYVILHFADISKSTAQAFGKRGGFAVDCDHNGSHCGAPAALVAAQWQFLKDHPFGVNPDPYASGLPASFPTYCQQYPVEGDAGICP
jgi:hypothetical protein